MNQKHEKLRSELLKQFDDAFDACFGDMEKKEK